MTIFVDESYSMLYYENGFKIIAYIWSLMIWQKKTM